MPNNVRLMSVGNKEILKNLKFIWRNNLVPSLPSRNKTLAKSARNYARADVKVFLSIPTVFDLFALF